MGKKKKPSNSLGRALIKDRFTQRKFAGDSSMLHTAEVADGYDWGRLNLKSVTEESSFQEFLSTAELAGTEFQAEKLNITFVNPINQVGLLSDEEKKRINAAKEENKLFLQIPRRPDWDEKTTPEELESLERDSFLEWRRKLALFQETHASDGLLITPYEKNIEFWRQLWRVVEKSDIVVQIVDARNPLLFRCEDLERYVEEMAVKQGNGKTNVILINKADFLTTFQRKAWAKFFDGEKIRVAFYSAIQDPKKTKEEEDDKEVIVDIDNGEEEGGCAQKNDFVSEENILLSRAVEGNALNESDGINVSPKYEEEGASECGLSSKEKEENIGEKIQNSFKILTRDELISLFKDIKLGRFEKTNKNLRTVGLVGYPNVGKSSTINSLLEAKKVSVSATPGKTKHFQTHFLDSELLLCDCPGLVMPSFVSTQSEMVLWGILPIDTLRDHVPSVSLLASLIPRHIFEDLYGIMLPYPSDSEDLKHPLTSEELLNAYGYIRGYMTQRGLPDNPRTARYVLKDFVNGKLLYCRAPPSHNQEEFHTFPNPQKKSKVSQIISAASSGSSKLPPQLRVLKQNKLSVEELEKNFFRQASIGVHIKGIKPAAIGGTLHDPSAEDGSSTSAKPWKKHNNRNKKEKLRRVYSYLDE